MPRQNRAVAVYPRSSKGWRGGSNPSPENGLSRFPVLRVCRRHQAGNLDDSTGSQRDTTRKTGHNVPGERTKCKWKVWSANGECRVRVESARVKRGVADRV